MNIDRRRILIGASALVAEGIIGLGATAPVRASSTGDTIACRFHPLTRSLLDRAHRIGRDGDAPDKAKVEQTIRRFAKASGYQEPLVMKWMDTPTDAHDHLSRFGLDALLLDMETKSFWQRAQHPASPDEETFDRAFEAWMMANELLRIDEQDRTLTAPKLLAKSQAISTNAADEEVFRVRAVSSQIGWLETSMADAAAEAIANVELLLGVEASEGSVSIGHQLKVFEAHENGLLATWETPDALICVPEIPGLTTRAFDPGHSVPPCPLWMAPALQEIN
jgi:hypothetical protein